MDLILLYGLIFFALFYIAQMHHRLFLLFFTSSPGRLCLLLYIMSVTYTNRMIGLILAFIFILIDINCVIRPTPNIISANSATFIEGNFLEQNRTILNEKIKYENYVFVKPFQYSFGQRPPSTNRILPYGS